MSAVIIGVITFLCVLGGTIIGMVIRNKLPEHHLSSDSRDTVKLGAGLVATLSALVLGLLVSSAKESFDKISDAITDSSTKLILLDRTLRLYGEQTDKIREDLRNSITRSVNMIWDEADKNKMTNFEKSPALMEILGTKIRKLKPDSDIQRAYQAESLQLCKEILQTRWLVIEETQISLPPVFLVILLFWLTILFASFGLLAPANKTVIIVLIFCGMSIAGAIFLIEEMNKPMTGILKVSKAPLIKAVELMRK